MSTRYVTSLVVDCDGCSTVFEYDEVVRYFDSESDAHASTVDADWRSDGEHDWCEECQNVPHECAPDPEDKYTCARCSTPLGFEDEVEVTP